MIGITSGCFPPLISLGSRDAHGHEVAKAQSVGVRFLHNFALDIFIFATKALRR